MYKSYLLLLPFLLFLHGSLIKADQAYSTISGKVIKVKDGDTIELLVDGKPVTVRLEHVDCPEKKQPFGTAAKQFTAEKCFGKTVRLIHSNKYDRNGRLIGVVMTDSVTNLNKELVKQGYAWHFLKYSRDSSYSLLERTARKLKRGLWNDNHPVAPWEWRKPKKK